VPILSIDDERNLRRLVTRTARMLTCLICGGDREAPRPRTLRLDHPHDQALCGPEGAGDQGHPHNADERKLLGRRVGGLMRGWSVTTHRVIAKDKLEDNASIDAIGHCA
jgi:hypothetical protein